MSAEEDFKQVGAELADLGVRISRMMGSPALKDQVGKVFASLQRDGAMVFRLVRDTPEHTAALELPGASLFDPSGQGRAVKDWVVVPHSSAERWTDLAEARPQPPTLTFHAASRNRRAWATRRRSRCRAAPGIYSRSTCRCWHGYLTTRSRRRCSRTVSVPGSPFIDPR